MIFQKLRHTAALSSHCSLTGPPSHGWRLLSSPLWFHRNPCQSWRQTVPYLAADGPSMRIPREMDGIRPGDVDETRCAGWSTHFSAELLAMLLRLSVLPAAPISSFHIPINNPAAVVLAVVAVPQLQLLPYRPGTNVLTTP